MVFGKILKRLRQANNLTQEELAQKINNSRSNIANYENEKNMPSIEILEKLSEVFNVSTDYLLGKSDIPNPEIIDIKDIDIGFATGYKGLNKENKETLKNIMTGLLAKQKLEENNNSNDTK